MFFKGLQLPTKIFVFLRETEEALAGAKADRTKVQPTIEPQVTVTLSYCRLSLLRDSSAALAAAKADRTKVELTFELQVTVTLSYCRFSLLRDSSEALAEPKPTVRESNLLSSRK